MNSTSVNIEVHLSPPSSLAPSSCSILTLLFSFSFCVGARTHVWMHACSPCMCALVYGGTCIHVCQRSTPIFLYCSHCSSSTPQTDWPVNPTSVSEHWDSKFTVLPCCLHGRFEVRASYLHGHTLPTGSPPHAKVQETSGFSL